MEENHKGEGSLTELNWEQQIKISFQNPGGKWQHFDSNCSNMIALYFPGEKENKWNENDRLETCATESSMERLKKQDLLQAAKS